MRARGLLLVLSALFLASQGFAGWVGEQVNTGPQGEETTETIYVQKNKMKTVGPEGTIMFDLEKGLFYMISPSPEHKVYWCGTPEEMRKETEETKKKMEEEFLKQLPPEQREAYEKRREEMKGETEEPKGEKKLIVEVKKTSETAAIAGYPTRKYQVWVNGELRKELWLSTKIRLADEVDLKKMRKFSEAMSGPEAEESYESSPDYMQLMETGAEMKSISYHGGGSWTTEMKKIEQKKIPDSQFEVPKGYRKVTLFELHQLQQSMGEKGE